MLPAALPGYAPGTIVGQNSFQAAPGNAAGSIQTATTFAGSQAFQVTGTALVDNTTFNGGNFWYREYTAGTLNPVGGGTPFVQVRAQVRTSGSLALATDIPFAGLYLEGFTAGIPPFIPPQQQSITPIMVNLNGGVTVFTNTTTGGTNMAVSTADGLLAREQWHLLHAELNFNTQTFRLYIQGQSTPVQFVTNGSGTAITPITDVPFRNANGATVSIAEIGMIGFFGRDPATGTPVQPLNNFFIDDYTVTATTAPVPEPGWLLLVGFAGTAAARAWRRRRAG
jgi:hypothetical protein